MSGTIIVYLLVFHLTVVHNLTGVIEPYKSALAGSTVDSLSLTNNRVTNAPFAYVAQCNAVGHQHLGNYLENDPVENDTSIVVGYECKPLGEYHE